MIVFVDEIEKAFAGTGTDMSGVKTEMTGTMLRWMQDHAADGVIFNGPQAQQKAPSASQPARLQGSAPQHSIFPRCRTRLLEDLAKGCAPLFK